MSSALRAASSSTRRPPRLWPIHATGAAGTIVSSRSSSCVSSFQGGSQSERPWPRRSGASTWYRSARRSSASRRKRRPCAETPCTQTMVAALASPHSCTWSRIRVTLASGARRPLRHPREPAGPRTGACRGGGGRGRPLAARRRLRHAEPLAAGDAPPPRTRRPWPLEPLAGLGELPAGPWLRGNGERCLREPPLDRPEVMESYAAFRGGLPEDVVDRLYGLPQQAELDGVLYVHGSPLSDVESFAPQPQPGEERLLDGVRDRLVVFGHSHQQFRRPGR